MPPRPGPPPKSRHGAAPAPSRCPQQMPSLRGASGCPPTRRAGDSTRTYPPHTIAPAPVRRAKPRKAAAAAPPPRSIPTRSSARLRGGGAASDRPARAGAGAESEEEEEEPEPEVLFFDSNVRQYACEADGGAEARSASGFPRAEARAGCAAASPLLSRAAGFLPSRRGERGCAPRLARFLGCLRRPSARPSARRRWRRGPPSAGSGRSRGPSRTRASSASTRSSSRGACCSRAATRGAWRSSPRAPAARPAARRRSMRTRRRCSPGRPIRGAPPPARSRPLPGGARCPLPLPRAGLANVVRLWCSGPLGDARDAAPARPARARQVDRRRPVPPRRGLRRAHAPRLRGERRHRGAVGRRRRLRRAAEPRAQARGARGGAPLVRDLLAPLRGHLPVDLVEGRHVPRERGVPGRGGGRAGLRRAPLRGGEAGARPRPGELRRQRRERRCARATAG